MALRTEAEPRQGDVRRGECPRCGGMLTQRYEREFECPRCGYADYDSMNPKKEFLNADGVNGTSAVRKPDTREWATWIRYGYRYSAFEMCQWPECWHTGDAHADCVTCCNRAGRYYLCQHHRGRYRAEFGLEPPLWSEMALYPVAHVTVRYYMHKGKPYIMEIDWPPEVAGIKKYSVALSKRFREENGNVSTWNWANAVREAVGREVN